MSDAETGSAGTVAGPEAVGTVVDRLAALGDPFFALLDAARDPGVLRAVGESDRPHRSLYEGPEADDLAEFGPFLVELAPDAPLLRRLVDQGWGRSWGVYLASRAGFDDLRHHFRHFLRAEIPGGRSALFRFYDPRVLRDFLPSWSAEDSAAFFGPVDRFAVESADGASILDFPAPTSPPRPR